MWLAIFEDFLSKPTYFLMEGRGCLCTYETLMPRQCGFEQTDQVDRN